MIGGFKMNALTKTTIAALAFLLASCGPSANQQTNLESSSGIRLGQEAKSNDEIAIGTVGIRGFRQDGMSSFCSGSLLPNNLVVTAAHCVDTSMQLYIIFSTDSDANPNGLKSVARFVDGSEVHPDYQGISKIEAASSSAPTPGNDIALLHYEGSTPSNYKPVQFLKDYRLLKPGVMITIAGYGIHDDAGAIAAAKNPKTAGDTSWMSTSGLGKLRSTEVALMGSLTSSEVVLDQSKGTGTCQGDSGGPAYLRVNKQLFMFGVLSRGSARAPGSPCTQDSVYTEVGPYIKFLSQAARQLAQTSTSAKNFNH